MKDEQQTKLNQENDDQAKDEQQNQPTQTDNEHIAPYGSSVEKGRLGGEASGVNSQPSTSYQVDDPAFDEFDYDEEDELVSDDLDPSPLS